MSQPDPFAAPAPGATPPATPAARRTPAPPGGAASHGYVGAVGTASGTALDGSPVGSAVPDSALAPPWRRLGAALLNALLAVVTLGIGYLIWLLVTWGQGANPGQKLLGMRVVTADSGATLSFGEMLVRNFVLGYLALGVFTVVTLGIGPLVDVLMVFGARRQRLLDRVAKTLVVRG